MSWERRRTGTYYYRARRVGDRVVKEYVGAGLQAELAAAQDAADRSERIAASVERRAVRAELNALEAPLDELAGAVESLARAGLLLAGYHRHHGGEWRKRRHG